MNAPAFPSPAVRVVEDANCCAILIDGNTEEGRAALRAWSAPRPGERREPFDLSADLVAYAAAVAEVKAELAARPVLMSAAEIHQRVAERARKAVSRG